MSDLHIDSDTLAFLDLLRRGTSIDIHAEDPSRVYYVTTTEILDSEPDGEGGLLLTLDATIEEGVLAMTKAMIALAEHDGDCWCVRHGSLVFRFGLAEGEPAFGPDGFFANDPDAWDAARRSAHERDARRDAKWAEQEGR